MALSKARVTATPGSAQVVIDGGDISDQLASCRIDIDAQGGRVPILWLEARSGGIQFEGDVEVRSVSEGTPALEFLQAMDPEILDKAVNDLLQIQGGSYAELALVVLRQWAGGV
jgi:hypothetical protein